MAGNTVFTFTIKLSVWERIKIYLLQFALPKSVRRTIAKNIVDNADWEIKAGETVIKEAGKPLNKHKDTKVNLETSLL